MLMEYSRLRILLLRIGRGSEVGEEVRLGGWVVVWSVSR